VWNSSARMGMICRTNERPVDFCLGQDIPKICGENVVINYLPLYLKATYKEHYIAMADYSDTLPVS